MRRQPPLAVGRSEARQFRAQENISASRDGTVDGGHPHMVRGPKNYPWKPEAAASLIPHRLSICRHILIVFLDSRGEPVVPLCVGYEIKIVALRRMHRRL